MTAAETGHLVFGTLHTTGAVKTIDRIIDALPVEEREQTKSFLAQSLLAVVTQMLVKSHDGRGRRAICEIMVMTKAIGMAWATIQTILRMRAGASGISPGELEQCHTTFAHLKPGTARQVLEFQNKQHRASRFGRSAA